MKAAKQNPQKQASSPQPEEHSDEHGYNGWDNYETWLVNLWLTNDQGTYETMRELVAEYEHSYQAGDAIREYVEELNPLADQATLYTDLLNGALQAVNWREVAEAFKE